MRFLRILQESLKKTCCFLEGAPDSAQQQARCCCAVFILEMELHMQFILNQDGELIITDEAEEAFDLDEQSGRQDLNLRPFGPQPNALPD